MKAKFTCTGIRMGDLEESLKFYTSLLGMKATGRNKMDPTGSEVASL